MDKKYNSILILVISFMCFYLSTIFGVEYLNIAFIPIFIYIQNKNSKKKQSWYTFRKNQKK